MKIAILAALLALAGGAAWADPAPLPVDIKASAPEKAAKLVKARLPQVIAAAKGELATAGLGLGAVKRIEVVASDRNSRYVGWKAGDGGVLRIALASFLDEKPDFTGRAMALAVGRRTPGSRLADPYLRRVRGKDLVGSVYDDIQNEPFFAALEKVLSMAEKLPAALRKPVEAIDSIHYAPHSRHFPKGGTVDAVAGYYNQALGEPGNRMVFVRRGVRWTSEMGLLLLMVHEGTHVLQHAEVERAVATGTMPDLVAAWKGNEKDERGISHRMRFECEATANEVKAAIALDAPPELVEESQYVQLCVDVKSLIVQWRDRRLRQGIERSKGG